MTERNYVPMDDVIAGVTKTVNLLNYMIGERSQLYGTIIYLMQMLEKNEIAMPTVEAMREYQKSFYVKFDVVNDEFLVSLVERTSEEGEEDGTED